METKTKTGYYVPVLRDEAEPSPPPESTDKGLDWLTFWFFSLLGIAAVGFLGLGMGWFKSPEQALIDQNQELQRAIATQSAQLQSLNDKQTKLNQCFKEFSK